MTIIKQYLDLIDLYDRTDPDTPEADALISQMDVLWWLLTEDEQKRVNDVVLNKPHDSEEV